MISFQDVTQMGALRAAGKPGEALCRAAELLRCARSDVAADRQVARECMVRHFFGKRCLLLELARWAWLAHRDPRNLLEPFQADEALRRHFHPKVRKLLDARLKLLLALAEHPHEEAELVRRLQEAIRVYDAAWRRRDQAGAPLRAMRTLPYGLWPELFGQLANAVGACSPGLLAVCDQLAYVVAGEEALQAQRSVDTWCMFACAARNEGLLAPLRLERTPGSGGLYPDPLGNGYVWLEEPFREGLANAWQAALGTAECDFDVRWRLGQVADQPLDGQSAEAALAAALRALAQGEPLDPHVAVTAQFLDPQAGTLCDVGGLDLKPLDRQGTFRRKHVDEILVAELQDVEGGAEILDGEVRFRLQFVKVASLDEAYHRLVRWQRLLRRAKQGICRELEQQAAAADAPYVLPALSRYEPHRERLATPGGRPVDPYEPLSADEVARLCAGRPGCKRVFLLGPSGRGKSALLRHIAQSIACGEGDLLPLRIEHLADFPWQFPGQVAARLAESLRQHLPELIDRQRLRLVQRLLSTGGMVLLLDGLDRYSPEDLRGLGTLLHPQAGRFRECAVVLAGRPYAWETWRGQLSPAWELLRLEPLDRRRQQALLAGTPSADWLPRAAAERTLGPLLAEPLWLQWLRRLAGADRLCGLPGRDAALQRAAELLIEQGRSRLSGPRRRAYTALRVERLLRRIGWWMIRRGNFSGVATAAAFEQLREDCRLSPRDLDVLEQVDLTVPGRTERSVSSEGLAWRYQPFAEYFAAAHLAAGRPKRLRAVVAQHARQPQWQGVLRFTLSAVYRRGRQRRVDAAARVLMALGNPFALARAILDDGVQLAPALDRICRWLVHWQAPFQQAWDESWALPEPSEELLNILRSLFQPRHRDSRCLYAAWELLDRFDEAAAGPIRRQFLAEYPAISAGGKQVAAGPCGRGLSAPGRPPELPQVARQIQDDMIAVAGGLFMMGSPADEPDREAHEVPHPVRLTAYRAARCPVTNAQFHLFDPSHAARWPVFQQASLDAWEHPVVNVSWYQAKMFSLWCGYRLLSEAQWELAACGDPLGGHHRFGLAVDEQGQVVEVDQEALSRVGVCLGGKVPFQQTETLTAEPRTFPVGTRWPNGLGFCDLLGNVWEWCEDWYGPYPREESADPGGPAAGFLKVARGGSFLSPAACCRPSARTSAEPSQGHADLGFRLAGIPQKAIHHGDTEGTEKTNAE